MEYDLTQLGYALKVAGSIVVGSAVLVALWYFKD